MDGRTSVVLLLVVAVAASTVIVVADEGEPMADAGLDRSVDLGETVYLDGSGSRAANGELVGFQWYVTPPDGERRQLEGANSSTHTYVPDSPGEWRFTLEVTASNDETSEDYVVVRVGDVEQTEEPDGSDQTDDGADKIVNDPGENSGSSPENDKRESTDGTDTPENTPDEIDNSGKSNQHTGEISISGASVVAQGTEHTYEAESDSEIVDYQWEYNARSGSSLGSGRKENIFFTDEQEGSYTIEVTGVTSSGAVISDEHNVVVVETETESLQRDDEPKHEIKKLEGTLLVGNSELLFGSNNVFDNSVPRLYYRSEEETVTFEADVEAEDGIELTYVWDFGDGTTTVTSKPEVEHVFITDNKGKHEFEVTVTAVDQYDRKRSKSRTARVLGKEETDSSNDLDLISKTNDDLTATFEVTSISSSHTDVLPKTQRKALEIHFGDGHSLKVFPPKCDGVSDCKNKGKQITHQYSSPGEYTAWISSEKLANTDENVRETVSFDSYTEYHYTERITEVAEYTAEENPGEGWERVGIDSIEQEVVDREELRISEDQHPESILSDDWRRIGTETETEQRRETRVAAQWPGSDWSLAESSVDTQTRRVGYDHVEVPNRGLAPDDATYVGTTKKYRTTTERERSTSRPSGSGWRRVRSTGTVRDGTGTTWRSSSRAPSSWRRVDYRTVTEYEPETERYCKQRTNRWGRYGRCIEWGERTVWDKDTTREYKFAYPTYSTEYLWERTVSTPEVYYEYRVPEYDEVDLHRWERTYTEEVEYGVYEKLEYETTTTYEWEKEVEREVDRASLTPPNTDEVDVIGDVSKEVYACGSGEGELEAEGCT